MQNVFFEGVTWYRKVAEQGSAGAQYHLGVPDMTGDGVEQDPVEGMTWYHKAAEQGHTKTQYNLGWLAFGFRIIFDRPGSESSYFS